LPGDAEGQGLNETHLKDLAQFQVRNQISNVQGASVPQPYGGTYRQIQVYVDPLKMEARNLSLNDVVESVNSSNLILPAGDVRIGSKDFNIYANSQFPDANSMNEMPLKSVGNSSVLVATSARRRLGRAAVQHRAHRRSAFGLRAGLQARRQQQHHHHREWHEAAIKHLVDIPAR
jgi:multidrug efflux pump subunit AcrB